MTFVTGQQLGLLLCKMFGLDANAVTGIWVHARLGELATIQVDYYIHELKCDENDLPHYKIVETDS